MDELRVESIANAAIVGVGDGSHGGQAHPDPRQRRKDEAKRSPDELAFLLRRAKAAPASLTDTRIELHQEDGTLRVRILDRLTGALIGEMSGEELAELAREEHVTMGVLGEWRK